MRGRGAALDLELAQNVYVTCGCVGSGGSGGWGTSCLRADATPTRVSASTRSVLVHPPARLPCPGARIVARPRGGQHSAPRVPRPSRSLVFHGGGGARCRSVCVSVCQSVSLCVCVCVLACGWGALLFRPAGLGAQLFSHDVACQGAGKGTTGRGSSRVWSRRKSTFRRRPPTPPH